MRLIARTQIAHLPVRIYERASVNVEGEECYGCCVATDNGIRIEIQRGLPRAKFLEILYHELLHGVEKTLDLRISEKLVHNLGVGLGDAMSQIKWKKR
jgi:hypothetical protein